MYVGRMATTLDTLQGAVDTIADATGCPVTLEDRDLHLVASSGHEDVIDEVRSSSILRRRATADVQELFATFGIARAEKPLRIAGDAAVGRLSRWCIPVRWRQVTHGYLWLLDPDQEVTARDLDGLQEVVDQAAASLALRSRAAERTSWAAGELLSDDAGRRARALDELGRHGALGTTARVRVIALAPANGSQVGPVNAWLLPRSAFVTTVGERAAVILPAHGDADTVARKAAGGLVAQHPGGVAAGISDAVDIEAAHRAWQQAGVALGVALRDTETPDRIRIAAWADLGALRLLAVADTGLLLATLADDRIDRLLALDHDALATVRAYLDLAGSVQQTASRLAIHRQTLYQRLRRVETLTGLDLGDGEQRLLAHLALTLARSAV
jgi:DNA-binding PucR family transcriptional regulator